MNVIKHTHTHIHKLGGEKFKKVPIDQGETNEIGCISPIILQYRE